MTKPTDYMTPGEAAEALMVSRSTVVRMYHLGDLQGFRVSARVIKIKRSSVERILEGNTNDASNSTSA